MTLEEKGDATLAIVILAVVFFLGLFVGKVWAVDYIYKKHVPDRQYMIQEDGQMLQYDYCNGCHDRPATEDEIESFWKKIHPEWYK